MALQVCRLGEAAQMQDSVEHSHVDRVYRSGRRVRVDSRIRGFQATYVILNPKR